MAIDLNRVIQATVDAVLEGRESAPQPLERSGKGRRHGLSAPRAFLIGAGAVTAGRLVARARSGDLLENLQQRLVDYEQRHFKGDEENDDEYLEDHEFDEDDEDYGEDYDEEPEAEAEEAFDEQDLEPRPQRRARSARA